MYLLYRLRDVHHQDISDRDICLSLVFEFIDQDLNTYLERCPPPGLGPDRIRVSQKKQQTTKLQDNVLPITLFNLTALWAYS